MNFMAKNLVAQSPAEQVSEILHRLRPLLRQSEAIIRDKAGDAPIDGVTPAMFRVLDALHGDGPQTVPALARVLGTGRQFIQRMVNDLVACGLVERDANPAHRKSWLIALTADGRGCVERSAHHEHAALDKLAEGVAGEDLQACLRVLDHFRQALAGREQPLETGKPARRPKQRMEQVPEKQVTRPAPPVPATAEAEPATPESATLEPAAPPRGLNWNGGGGLRIA